jgi:hypothetical protein
MGQLWEGQCRYKSNLVWVCFFAVVERAVAYSEASCGRIILPAKSCFPLTIEHIVVPDEPIADKKALATRKFFDLIWWNRVSPSRCETIDSIAGDDKSFGQFFFQHRRKTQRNRWNYFWFTVNASDLCWRFPVVATVSDHLRRNGLSETYWYGLNINEDVCAFSRCERIGSGEGGSADIEVACHCFLEVHQRNPVKKAITMEAKALRPALHFSTVLSSGGLESFWAGF